MFELWVRLIENSAVMSVAVLVLLGLTRLTRGKATARVRLGCWMLVAVGLLLPVRPVLWTVEMPEVVPGFSGFVGFSGVAISDVVVDDTWAVGLGLDGVIGVDGFGYDRWVASEGVFSGSGGVYYMPLVQNAASFDVNWRVMLPVVWAVGVLLFLSVCVVRHLWFVRKIRRWAKSTTETDVYEILTDVCRRVGLKQLPKLMVCPLTISPVMLGLFRPVIILPDAAEPPERLRLILLHEVIHIKRKDNALRLLSLLATAAHWFNPLVYFMHRAVHQEIELACDAAVLRHAGDEARMAYGLTLMNAARRVQVVPVLASAMSGEGRNLKRRLADIIEKKHTRRGLAFFCAFLMIGGVLLAGMLAYERDNGNNGADVAGQDETDHEIIYTVTDENGEPQTQEPLATENGSTISEPTDSLVIHGPGYVGFNRRFMTATRIFRQLYPEVDLTVELIGDSRDSTGTAYTQRMRTELMAGIGADIIITHFLDDLHSPMQSGLFRDLAPLWDNDPSFAHKNQLNHAVMDAGVYRGRRYIIPLSYNMIFRVFERNLAARFGFDLYDDMDVNTFYNRLAALLPDFYADPKMQIINVAWGDYLTNDLPIGIPLADFERGIALPYEEALRDFMEALGVIVRHERAHGDWDIINQIVRETNCMAAPVMQGAQFYQSWVFPFQTLQDYSRLQSAGYAPFITTVRDVNGEVHATVSQSVAVRANSPNYVNAWRFIQILLSQSVQDESQTATFWNFEGIVVNNAAAEIDIRHSVTMFYPPLHNNEEQVVIDLTRQITRANLTNRTLSGSNLFDREIRGFFHTFLMAYIREEITLDNAMDQLRSRIRFYLSE